ncbi:MAG: hypothetical protein CVU22_00965 [Betaproteobacteria bacterium HGW-Betaproteobacteria-16]|nr:MAG: hypothetical protein CVU22_00965 [Betaproteobacteria bacterium HGW-Betaproteobacteria-16]
MKLAEGNVFRSSLRPATQENINRFGNLHGTTGKTHTDPEYARQSAFGGVIVQGALVMAPIFDICTELFGSASSERTEIEAKFVSFTRPGDAVSVQFDVVKHSAESIELSYSCTLPDGKKVVIGTITHHYV